jgi:hypothetical protein
MGSVLTLAKVAVPILLGIVLLYIFYRIANYGARRFMRAYISGWSDETQFDETKLVWRPTRRFLKAKLVAFSAAWIVALLLIVLGLGGAITGNPGTMLYFVLCGLIVLLILGIFVRFHPAKISISNETLVVDYWRRQKHLNLNELTHCEIIGARRRLGINSKFGGKLFWIPGYFSGITNLWEMLDHIALSAEDTADA